MICQPSIKQFKLKFNAFKYFSLCGPKGASPAVLLPNKNLTCQITQCDNSV